jgi:hypothetical protein
MFRSISENPNKPFGKYNDKNSAYGKATHYTAGNTDNEMIGAKSTLQRSFVDYGVVPKRGRIAPPAP